MVLWHIANTLRFCSVVGGFLQFLQIGVLLPTALPLLGAFAKLRKATITFVVSVCLSVPMEQLGSHWTYFHETLCVSVHCRSYNIPPPVPFLNQINPVHVAIPLLEGPLCSLILPSNHRSSKCFLSLTSPHQNPVCTSPVSHTCHMPCPSHSWFDHPNNIWWGEQIISPFLMYSSSVPLLPPLL